MKKLVLWVVVGAVAAGVVLGVVGVRTVRRLSEHWSGPGAEARLFGETAMNRGVGLVELHRARHGRYPASPSDIEFLSVFDRTDLERLEYASSEDGGAYYIAVARDLPMADDIAWPPSYWNGTGYDPTLEEAATKVDLNDFPAGAPLTFKEGFADVYLSAVNLAVGQVELHKLRCGHYPETLDDLRFLASGESGSVLGQPVAVLSNPHLAAVEYTLAHDGRSYDVRIKGPIAGTRTVDLPDEYWVGTGYGRRRESDPAR